MDGGDGEDGGGGGDCGISRGGGGRGERGGLLFAGSVKDARSGERGGRDGRGE